MERVLSIFGGIGLLDDAFADAGCHVSHGPELLRGVDVCGWHPRVGHVGGVIGGSPCQDFSDARRCAPTGDGVKMLREFLRVVVESGASWFLLENVRRVPAVSLPGFSVQRLMLDNADFGGCQRRLRCFQFGSVEGSQIAPLRAARLDASQLSPTLTGSSSVDESEAWRLQGHKPRPLALSSTRAVQAIANGVPWPMARAVAWSVTRRVSAVEAAALCACGCGRWLPPGRSHYAQECRQRWSRGLRFARRRVTFP